VHATGDVFEGTFRQGKLVGEGAVTLRNGDVINARWRRDSTAEGTITYSNGSLYTGSLLSNRPDGYGVMEYIPRGARYDGQWQHGRPHGAGTLTFPNGDFVQGDWSNGACSLGHGRRTFVGDSRFFSGLRLCGSRVRGGKDDGSFAQAAARVTAGVKPEDNIGEATYTGEMSVTERVAGLKDGLSNSTGRDGVSLMMALAMTASGGTLSPMAGAH